MNILVTGGTGFIGQALLPALEGRGHTITLLSRQLSPFGGRYRSIQNLDAVAGDTGIDAAINLAGASMAGKRWSKRYKQELIDSRLDTTNAVLGLFEQLEKPPACLLSASAIGYYGHHGDELLDEQGQSVAGFAQSLCAQWEKAANRASDLGVRTCLMRLGVVLDNGGGAFEQMALPFRLGVANWIGDGRQWLSWIHREDVVACILYLLENENLSGPINLTAPEPATARGLCEAMRRQKRTLLTLPMPAPVMRLMVGEVADELLINGQRVIPAALQDHGFQFRFASIDEALKTIWQA